MSLLRERVKEANRLTAQYPQHKSAIIDLYQLMEDEITEGGSPDHEFELFQSSVKQLIEDD